MNSKTEAGTLQGDKGRWNEWVRLTDGIKCEVIHIGGKIEMCIVFLNIERLKHDGIQKDIGLLVHKSLHN